MLLISVAPSVEQNLAVAVRLALGSEKFSMWGQRDLCSMGGFPTRKLSTYPLGLSLCQRRKAAWSFWCCPPSWNIVYTDSFATSSSFIACPCHRGSFTPNLVVRVR